MLSGRHVLSRSPIPSRGRVVAPLLLGAAGVVLVAGCGGSTSSGSGSSAAPPPPASSSSGSAGTTVTADETDFHIQLSQADFAPGTYTFQTKNNGKFPHALTIDGPGVAKQATATLPAGQSGSVTVTLQPGTYTFYCPVDGHRSKGMQMQVTVAAAGTGSGTGSAPTTSSTGSSGGGAGGY